MLRYLILFLPVSYFAVPADAQDANYWSSSYGPGGFFTPGSVIADNGDSGVLFYNPALLSHDKRSAASISGTIYQWESIKFKDGAGSGLNLNSTAGSIVPLIASHTVRVKIKRPFTIVYALVHTPVISFEASQYRDNRFDVLDDSYSPGQENFIGQYTEAKRIRQTTALASAGFKVSPKLSAGINMEVQIRSQNYLLNYFSKAVINNSNGLDFPSFTNVSEYYLATNRHIGFQFRGGLSYDISAAHRLGLTVSSPLVHFSGNSSIVSNNEISNLNLDGIQFNLLATTRQSKLKSKWKMPLSIGIGYLFHYKKYDLYLAGEYFAGVKDYNMINPDAKQFIRTDSAASDFSTYLIRMKDARKSILNVAFGISMQVKQDFKAFLSFRTDFSYADQKLYKDTDGYLANITNWDIYHCQVGVNMKRKKFNLRTGFLLSYGSSKRMEQGINFDNPTEMNLLIGDVGPTKGSYIGAGFMISYIHNL